VCSIAFIVAYVVVAVLRMRYRFELEWIEGASVVQVRPLVDGHALYVRPSISFVPGNFPPYMVPKLLETGTAVSVAAFAALRELDAEERPEEDPWERIAAALDPAS
jgi:hypothetical protein